MTASETRPSRRRGLSDRQVAALKKKGTRYTVPDPDLRGHYVRVMPEGANVFVAVARDPYGKQVWATIGSADKLKIEDARGKAREAIARIKAGLPAVEPPPVKPDTLVAVAENWLQRHVVKNKLRSAPEYRRVLQKYILPHLGDTVFTAIRRSHVTRLLDHIEDNHGPRQADYALAIVSGMMRWYEGRHDDYIYPLARKMRRTNPKERARTRILDDDEIRLVWRAADDSGAFGAIVKMLLLTGQRRAKVVGMRWGDLRDGVWTIPAHEREKSTAGSLVLPRLALDIINAQPRLATNQFVFAGRGHGPYGGIRAGRVAFDRKLPPDMPRFVLHDLRRSARSLMSRAGVQSDHAERVLGHVIPGVEGIYDRHSYGLEKAGALQRLAALIETIINPPVSNVVSLHGSVQS